MVKKKQEPTKEEFTVMLVLYAAKLINYNDGEMYEPEINRVIYANGLQDYTMEELKQLGRRMQESEEECRALFDKQGVLSN